MLAEYFYFSPSHIYLVLAQPTLSQSMRIGPCDESPCLTRLKSPSMPLNQPDDPDFLIYCSVLQLKIGEVNKVNPDLLHKKR